LRAAQPHLLEQFDELHLRHGPQRYRLHAHAARAAQLQRVASVREPGNRRFDVLQNPEDAGHFILYEAYVSAEAAAAHKQTAHYAQWRDNVATMMAAPRQGVPMTGLFPRD
jgi:autoinducer 2-degrading protein